MVGGGWAEGYCPRRPTTNRRSWTARLFPGTGAGRTWPAVTGKRRVPVVAARGRARGESGGGRPTRKADATLRERERPHEEYRHLAAGVRLIGTEVVVAAAGGDSLGGELFDPGSERIGEREVSENAGRRRRSVVLAVLRAEQEH